MRKSKLYAKTFLAEATCKYLLCSKSYQYHIANCSHSVTLLGIGAVLKVLTTGLPALISWIKRKRQQG
uniref:Melittin n=1 Tax=Polistes sp. TaxID=30210 RepID=Q95Z19_POLSY|nr:melittin [Polistes sp. HQL-2001]